MSLGFVQMLMNNLNPTIKVVDEADSSGVVLFLGNSVSTDTQMQLYINYSSRFNGVFVPGKL